jgi:glutaredoxin
VVELDTHRIGSDLQDELAKITGRSTVPNVLVNGVSIGGGDDVEELHVNGALIQKITGLAGQKVTITKGK